MTAFEKFMKNFESNGEKFREALKGDGTFDYFQQIESLKEFANKVNVGVFVYMFGENLGIHYMEKFIDHKRDLLSFLNALDGNSKFFIIYEIKTNDSLYLQTINISGKEEDIIEFDDPRNLYF